MEQKTVLNLEFAIGEEVIAALILSVMHSMRNHPRNCDNIVSAVCRALEAVTDDKCADEQVDEETKEETKVKDEEKPKRSRPSRAKKPAPKPEPEPADDEDEADEDTDDEDQEDEAPAKDTKKKGNREITHDDVRDLMADVIEEDEDTRPKVLKLLKQYGAKSVSALKDEELEAFYEELEALKA